MCVNTQTGVVLMNMGGPSSLDEVRAYMQRVLSDGRLIRLPGGPLFQEIFARTVSKRREARVRDRYAAIGGASPLLEATTTLAAQLARALSLPVKIAMRYSLPNATTAVKELVESGVRDVIGVPLYPQYSSSTTASSVHALEQALPDGLSLHVVERHHQEPGFLETLAASARAGLEEAGKGAHLLLTAHSVPESYTRSGDPYIHEVRQTAVSLLARLLPTPPASLAFQSAMRFGRWHGPGLEEELDRLLVGGVRRLVVQPISFASENLETLYDLDIAFSEMARSRGIESFLRQGTPGASPAYVEGLARLVRAALPHDGSIHA